MDHFLQHVKKDKRSLIEGEQKTHHRGGMHWNLTWRWIPNDDGLNFDFSYCQHDCAVLSLGDGIYYCISSILNEAVILFISVWDKGLKGVKGESKKLLQSSNHGNVLFKSSNILIEFTPLNLPDSSYKQFCKSLPQQQHGWLYPNCRCSVRLGG